MYGISTGLFPLICTNMHTRHSSCPIFGSSGRLRLAWRRAKPCLGLAHAERGQQKQRVIYFILALIRQLRKHVKLQFVSSCIQ